LTTLTGINFFNVSIVSGYSSPYVIAVVCKIVSSEFSVPASINQYFFNFTAILFAHHVGDFLID
jgi:hypothetical protein